MKACDLVAGYMVCRDSESKEENCCVTGVSCHFLGEGRWPVSTRSGSKKTEPVFEIRRNAYCHSSMPATTKVCIWVSCRLCGF